MVTFYSKFGIYRKETVEKRTFRTSLLRHFGHGGHWLYSWSYGDMGNVSHISLISELRVKIRYCI